MDLRDLKKILNLMNENDLLEVEIEEEGKRLRLRRAAPHGEPVPTVAPAPAAPVPAPAPAEAASAAEESELITIRAPMVGSFYRAPAPDADPYVDVGSKVEHGAVVCIVEAMKVMNEIKAEVSGEIVKACVKNGEAVEYGQALFLVKPAA